MLERPPSSSTSGHTTTPLPGLNEESGIHPKVGTSPFYGLNIFVLPNSYVEILTANVMVFGGGTSEGVIRFGGGKKGGVLTVGLMSL